MPSTATASTDDAGERGLEPVLVQQLGGATEDEGRRLLVGPSLLVGRDNPAFAGRYPALSRRHAEITPERDHLRITDLGSRHGTYVQGRRIERAVLDVGDLVELGGIGFLVTAAPATFVPTPHPRFAFASYAFGTLLGTVCAARRSRRPLVLVGESGVGKSALAEELVLGEGLDAPPSSRTWDLTAERPRTAPGEVLVVDRLDEAGDATQRELLAALRSAEGDPAAPRIVILSCASPAELVAQKRLQETLLPYLEGWVLRVPSLRERPEDVLPIVRAQLRALSPDEPWAIHPTLMTRLATDRWAGNVRALHAEIERLYLSASERCLVDPPAGNAASSWRAGGQRRVASDASWVEGPDGRREVLGARRVLRAVLSALLDAHQRGGALLSSREIARLAWPGERMLPRAAANRVYVAVTGLRKLGFGPTIENTGEGYRFVAGSIEVVSSS